MTALPEDDDLSELLSGLDEVSGEVDILKKSISHPKKSIPTTEKLDIDVPEHSSDPKPPISSSNDGEDELNKIYNSSVHELLNNYRKDRNDVDELIKYLWERLKKSEPSRVLFETLAVSLRTKSEANSNLLKLIDTLGKKTNKVSGIDGLDLESLLDD